MHHDTIHFLLQRRHEPLNSVQLRCNEAGLIRKARKNSLWNDVLNVADRKPAGQFFTLFQRSVGELYGLAIVRPRAVQPVAIVMKGLLDPATYCFRHVESFIAFVRPIPRAHVENNVFGDIYGVLSLCLVLDDYPCDHGLFAGV